MVGKVGFIYSNNSNIFILLKIIYFSFLLSFVQRNFTSYILTQISHHMHKLINMCLFSESNMNLETCYGKDKKKKL